MDPWDLKAPLAARAIRRNLEPVDDLVQEGLIVAWRVLQEKPDVPLGYVLNAIDWRWNELVGKRRAMLGSETPGTKRYRPQETACEDMPALGARRTSHETETNRRVDMLELLRRADLSDSDKEIVIRLYWLDQHHSDVRELMFPNRGRQYVFNRFSREILPRLKAVAV